MENGSLLCADFGIKQLKRRCVNLPNADNRINEINENVKKTK